ncbi:MAG: acyl-CoA dehydrogenase family protein, partial [Actinomycetota bacterium]|nr:acyl-CoA dehydrogenase family protein [Actinomycetota bacterium]
MSRPQTLGQLFALDSLLEPEEIAIRDTVRKFGDERLRPHIADWFEEAHLPARDLAKELGALGALGMHLDG